MIATQPVRGLLLLACLGAPIDAASAQEEEPKMPADVDPKTTDSGLKYSVLSRGGPGPSPQMGDLVMVHYTGWLTDGTQFDSSRQRGQPSEFRLGEVIEGWNEGLQLMTPGARFKLTIPPDLAYGPDGRPPVIPREATLVFDVELLSFEAMPRFRKLDPDATKTTDSGLKYQVLEPGSGDPPQADDPFEFELAVWGTEGDLLQMSAGRGRTQKARASDLRLPVLKEAFLLMRPGARMLIEVPPELLADRGLGGLQPEPTTIWHLHLIRVIPALPVPEFVLPGEDDLMTTDSGLKYQVVAKGEGESPRMGQTVKVHYAGWLADGTLFDSSFNRGEPAEFVLGEVIAGWNEGLQQMQPGAVYRFVIPPQLAYGERGVPPDIGPNATLVFWVKLLE
jgi:peptidylprolyl isomerase